MRVLDWDGVCIFACPVYTRLEHVKRAFLDEHGGLVFTDGPAYHGDPIREKGVPVFYEFGLNIIDDLNTIGFSCEIGVNHSLINGYFSNNNPYKVGHMWPIVIKCKKNKLLK